MPGSGLLWSLAIETEKPHLRHSRAADALSNVKNNEYIMTSIAKIYIQDRKTDKARMWFENSLRIYSDYGDTCISKLNKIDFIYKKMNYFYSILFE
jgi:pre-mRNA-processing factor 6